MVVYLCALFFMMDMYTAIFWCLYDLENKLKEYGTISGSNAGGSDKEPSC